MELGEGLCKLRKMNLESGPFYRFENEISAVLDFIYQTQLELAACEFYHFFPFPFKFIRKNNDDYICFPYGVCRHR